MSERAAINERLAIKALETPDAVMPDGSLRHSWLKQKYHIQPLTYVGRRGYEVTRHGLNVMPNRLEFSTIDDAMRAIECLEYVGHEPALFWDVWNTWPNRGK